MDNLKVVMISSLMLLGLVVLISACGSNKGDTAGNDADVERLLHTGSSNSQPVPVKVQEIRLGSLELSARATGVLRSRYQVPISPEISGRIVEKIRDIGDPVAMGEAILRVDPEPYELALAQAQAGFSSAQVAYNQAQRDYRRAQELRDTEDISEFELETSHLAERTAKANLRMAEAAFKLARRNFRLTKISSPINGHIARLDVQIGQQVAPGVLLGMIVSLDNLEIEVGMSEQDIVNIRPGIEVRVGIDTFQNRKFQGKVRSVGVAGLDLGKTFPVIVAVDNSSGLLRPGMIADLEMIYSLRRDILAVPRSALVIGTDESTLYVLDGDIAVKHEVILGDGDGQKVIVESGLTVGDKLIIEGQNVLSDSVQVKEL